MRVGEPDADLHAPVSTNRLFAHALRILDDAKERYGRPFEWTFRGQGRRRFPPDSQYFGYLSPRLSDAAAEHGPDFEQGAEFIKLRYPEGEVDFVAGGCLTAPGSETATVDGRVVQLETALEIVAKKPYFRVATNQLKGRDLFDL